MISTVLVICGITLALGWLLLSVQARFRDDGNELIDAIDALLPQTQCAQCGYPGCRPYAEAVAAGAAIDLCPPGGNATFEGLKALLGRSEGASPPPPEPVLARIREKDCIGCFLCIRACPVDAIIGAPGYMHAVIEEECTGCELCVPACPVDCIDLFATNAYTTKPVPVSAIGAAAGGGAGCESKNAGGPSRTQRTPAAAQQASARQRPTGGRADIDLQASSTSSKADAASAQASHPCIGCNRCEPVCPANLAPRELLWLSAAGKWDAAAGLGLDRCIECRLCDRACPSQIPLAATFAGSKRILAATAARNAQAARAKARFEARTARLAAEQDAAQARRAERLARQQRLANTGEAAAP